MAELLIRVEGLDKLLRKVDAATADKTLRKAMHGSLQILRFDLKEYPEPPGPGDWPGFVSEKQRRYFFWALRQGIIEVPYKRQMARGLGGSWAQRIEGFAGRIKGIVGTNKPYAPYVMDAGQQAPIHRGRWQTVQSVAKKRKGDIERIFADEVDKAMRRA